MNDLAPHPTTTHRLFTHDRVAVGYASARPFVHPEVFARLAELTGMPRPVARALDVGCGTGMSSWALLDLAREVVGVDVSVPMLLRARRAEGLRYLASKAEDLPFTPGCFDLIVACGSIDWVDRSRFLPRAAELLTSGGWLVPLDFGDAGRSPEVPGLQSWHEEVFQPAFPRPPSPDPLVADDEAARCGFGVPIHRTFEAPCSFTASRYADFLMTESNVIAAVEYGERSAEEVRGWLGAELAPLFGGEARAVTFAGYIQTLQRHREE
jgi:SAM-dependent methyltransferase